MIDKGSVLSLASGRTAPLFVVLVVFGFYCVGLACDNPVLHSFVESTK